MSLINRMLQDLDARGGQPGPAAVSPEIKPVPPPERAFPWLRVGLPGALAVVLGASGYLAWNIQREAAPTPSPEVPVSIAGGAAPPAAAPAPAAASAPAAAAAAAAAAALEPAPAGLAPALSEEPAAQPGATRVPSAEPLQKQLPAQSGPRAARPAPIEAALAARRRQPEAPARKDGARAGIAVVPASKQAKGRSETDAQRAENAYRRALASLEDGRVTEAIGGLQGALRIDPRHEAARQTLVSLLIEAGRPDEAMRQLATALALEPRQPAMAMLLARLQIERGASGIDTLLRTLPYAAGNGDYHAFLAGALAREGRHREAAEHYGVALRTAPRNGVWWMGLALSLQAEKRQPEAAGAFQKALDSGTLSPELQGFVERKLKQLTR